MFEDYDTLKIFMFVFFTIIASLKMGLLGAIIVWIITIIILRINGY